MIATRLGYTYDWGNPHSDVGLSEFIIDEGATVEVHAVLELPLKPMLPVERAPLASDWEMERIIADRRARHGLVV